MKTQKRRPTKTTGPVQGCFHFIFEEGWTSGFRVEGWFTDLAG